MPEGEANKPKLLIEFEEPHSIQFTVNSQGVTPLQMLALAAWMEFEAKSQMQMMKAQQYEMMQQQAQRNKIEIPRSGMVMSNLK